MPKPRKPLAALKASGTYDRNKGRYSGRNEPLDDREIGEPYEWLNPDAQEAWREMVPTMPWLRFSHRGIVGITANLAGKMRRGELGLSGMNLLRQCLGALGATPADASKIAWTPDAQDEDPAAKYFS